MMEKFRQFMYGRYGNDLLNFALMLLGCVVTAVLSFIDVPYIHYLGMIPYLVVIRDGKITHQSSGVKSKEQILDLFK